MSARHNATALLWVWAVTLLSASALAQETERVSVDSSGDGANNGGYEAATSADGRFVAFVSNADNLVPGDTNGRVDVFARDRQTGTTTRISVNSSGAEGNDDSLDPSISEDGRFVAFWSRGWNLVPGDTNERWDIFVHDRQDGTTTRVSVDSKGVEGNNHSNNPSISGDGRFVAFHSIASNLVTGDTNSVADVFVHDRQDGTTTRVSVDSEGVEGNNGSYKPSISGDGRFVAFQSGATNLVPGDTNRATDVFVHDRQTGTTTRVSIDSAWNEGSGHSLEPSISGDGRFVAFDSGASDLVLDDTNGMVDVFVHDRQTEATTRISVDSSGNEGNDNSESPSISLNGRFVAFRSSATDLVPGDTNIDDDVFVHDRRPPGSMTTRVSVASSGVEGNGYSSFPSISGDGRFVAFDSTASNLAPGDTNGTYDVFVHGPYLTLEVSPETVTTGDAIVFTTWTGLPSGGTFLVLVDLDGTALFQLILKGTFDATGIWTLSGTVPPGLSGHVLTFKSLGFAPNGKGDISNAEAVTFN